VGNAIFGKSDRIAAINAIREAFYTRDALLYLAC
jgi:hypothetical protein